MIIVFYISGVSSLKVNGLITGSYNLPAPTSTGIPPKESIIKKFIHLANSSFKNKYIEKEE